MQCIFNEDGYRAKETTLDEVEVSKEYEKKREDFNYKWVI